MTASSSSRRSCRRAAHRRGVGARSGRQRPDVPARSRARKDDWFYVAIADVTRVDSRTTSGPGQARRTRQRALQQQHRSLDGRLRVLHARQVRRPVEADRQRRHARGPVEQPVQQLHAEDAGRDVPPHQPRLPLPDLRRRQHDGGGGAHARQVLRETAEPCDYGLWGNFRIGYTGNSLAHVDRTLYGANLHYEPSTTTQFGEKRLCSTALPRSLARWPGATSSAAPAARCTT